MAAMPMIRDVKDTRRRVAAERPENRVTCLIIDWTCRNTETDALGACPPEDWLQGRYASAMVTSWMIGRPFHVVMTRGKMSRCGGCGFAGRGSLTFGPAGVPFLAIDAARLKFGVDRKAVPQGGGAGNPRPKSGSSRVGAGRIRAQADFFCGDENVRF